MKPKQDCQHVYYGQWIGGKHYLICAKCGIKVESEAEKE
jgi:hypothetical protein